MEFYLIISFENGFRLAATNIEENVVTSYLVHEANCIVSMPEFALRLQISIDDKTTADIFRIFDTVRSIAPSADLYSIQMGIPLICRICAAQLISVNIYCVHYT